MEQPKVGQEVAVRGRSSEYLFGYFVTKVSPTGQITVEGNGDKIVFWPDGYERTSNKWFRRYLYPNVEELKESTRTERMGFAAANSIRKVRDACNVGNGWDKASLEAKIVELQALLDAAKKAVDEI